MANKRVTAEQWAECVTNHYTQQTHPRPDLMLSKLPNGAVIAMVGYLPNGKKRYIICEHVVQKFSEFKKVITK